MIRRAVRFVAIMATAGVAACGSSSAAPAPFVLTCVTNTGSGASLVCLVVSNLAAGGSSMNCMPDAGAASSAPGTCSSSGLYGCCVTPEPVGSTEGFSATCYYDSKTGDPAKATCTGTMEKWQTTVPTYGHL
jgi:hypothetical protein